GIKKYFDFLTLFKLRKILKENNISTLIASSANAGVYARLVRLLVDFKCIYVSHGWSCLYNGGRLKSIFCIVEKYLSLLTDVIWCVSKSDEKKAIEKIGIKETKIITVSNSVPQMPRCNNKPLQYKVLFVGRLTHPKRPELLANVISNKPQYSLHVVGGGERLESLKKQFSECENIHFLGEVNNFYNYHEYDLFSLISDSEGLPMSGLEAHTAAIPLLLSDVGGCFELIEGNGVLVENTEDDIGYKLDKIFDDYENYREQAIRASGKFVIENYASAYKSIILG
ncbi:TPA: glycosyltransferase, partial [Escherichia coli]|nr:glycosyltransferase [Escherichia coli]